MSGYVSRIIFQDGFSGTTNKFVRAVKEIGEQGDKASKDVCKLHAAIGKIKGVHTSKFKAVGLNTVNKNVHSMESKLQKMTNKPVKIKATAKVTRSDIKKAKKEAKELRRQLKDLTGKKYKVNVDVGGVDATKSKLSSLKGMLGGATGGAMLASGVAAVGAGALVGGKKLLDTGSKRQSQMVGLTHFLGGDAGKAKDMMKWASDNAAKTQFSQDEAIR